MGYFESELKVSIVIPAYNQAEYLSSAIESVLNQTVSVELIVIDDGSTDSTAELLASYNNVFYWESRSNSGQANTLNYGWSIAKGSILGYLSADDVLDKNAVKSTVDAFTSDPEAIVTYSDFELIDPNDHVVRYVKTPEFSFRRMLTRFECAPGPGAFFRRSALRQSGGWDISFRRVPDFEFWLRLALVGKFIRIPKPLAQWRVHDGSQSFSAIDSSRADEPIRVMRKFFGLRRLPSYVLEWKVAAMAYAYLISAQFHARSGRWGMAVSRFNFAILNYPNLIIQLQTWKILANVLFQKIFHKALWRLRKVFVFFSKRSEQ